MSATDGQTTGHQTALDRVAGGLSSEAARTELYRYASNVAEQMPPDASSWYVVGAVMQVNAVTRHELITLAKEAKKGGTILAGLLSLIEWFPRAGIIALGSAAVAAICVLFVAVPLGQQAYNAGWSAQESVRMKTWNHSACDSLGNVRHELRSQRSDVRALDRERIRRGC